MGMLDSIRAMFAPKKREGEFSATAGSGGQGGFAGGAVGRLTASLATWSGAVNYDLDSSLTIMRARARQLAQNNEHGKRFLSLVATNVVGAGGPKLQVRAYRDQRNPDKPTTLDKPANDAVEIHFDKWGKKCDIAGRMSFAQMQRVAIKAVARDGETLFRHIRDKRLPYGYALQLLEADRIDETINTYASNGNAIRMGVELASTGQPVALYVKRRHPGDRYGAPVQDIERVPMADLIHAFIPERAEQVRGYSWFHAIILRAQQLHSFNEAAVLAARIGASKVAALERKEDAQDAIDSMGDGKIGNALQINLEGGEMFELPPGYTLNSWNPDYPHQNFESFVNQATLGISAGLDVANHNLSGNMTGVNYSSARIAELSERELWKVLQDWWIETVVTPIYHEWAASAFIRGDITFPLSGAKLPADRLGKFVEASRFQGRRWQWVDPAKEMDANQKAIDARITSRTRICAEAGYEFDDVLDELQMEDEAIRAAGLQVSDVIVKPDPAEPPDEDEKALLGAMANLTHAVLAMAGREMPAPVINIAPAAVEVRAGDTHVTMAEGCVQLEATVEAPAVHNEVTSSPAQVVVAQPSETVETIERDAAGEIARIVRTVKE